jgi:hypothetical protein
MPNISPDQSSTIRLRTATHPVNGAHRCHHHGYCGGGEDTLHWWRNRLGRGTCSTHVSAGRSMVARPWHPRAVQRTTQTSTFVTEEGGTEEGSTFERRAALHCTYQAPTKSQLRLSRQLR